MAHNGRFGLGVRVLGLLALSPEGMHTSAEIAEALGTSPVMVRRVFQVLHAAGFLVQRKGPQGGARLKISPKAIGLGDVYEALTGKFLSTGEKEVDALLKRVREDAVKAMNETTIASLAKKMKKA